MVYPRLRKYTNMNISKPIYTNNVVKNIQFIVHITINEILNLNEISIILTSEF